MRLVLRAAAGPCRRPGDRPPSRWHHHPDVQRRMYGRVVEPGDRWAAQVDQAQHGQRVGLMPDLVTRLQEAAVLAIANERPSLEGEAAGYVRGLTIELVL